MMFYVLAICVGSLLASFIAEDVSSKKNLPEDLTSNCENLDSKEAIEGNTLFLKDKEDEQKGNSNTQVLAGKKKSDIKHLFKEFDGLSKATKKPK